ncbi:CHASE2 domain-containing protein [Phenylobacterium sp.]|uniref:CHASE2 domain-containing protein n=1 Tax=Phenylobacterium sp. TaxID=1871053 RepID=UPI003D2C0219
MLAGGTVGLLALNPFNLFTAFDGGLRNLIGATVAVDYADRARPRIAMVTANDDYLTLWDKRWPLGGRDHAEVIDQIIATRPKAIFMDFAFIGSPADPADADALVASLERASQHAMIFIGTPGNPDQGASATWPELVSLANLNPSVQLVSIAVAADAEPGTYPTDGPVDAQYPTAAIAIAEYIEPGSTQELRRRGIRSLDIQWSAPPPVNCRAHVEQEARSCENISAESWLRGTRLLLGGILRAPIPSLNYPEPFRIANTPLPTIEAADLTALEPEQAEALRGAVVFYGGAFKFTGQDTIEAAPYGPLPGVFAHAMALDNILTLRDSAVRSDSPLGGDRQSYRLIQALTIVTLALTLSCLAMTPLVLGFTPHTAMRRALQIEGWVLVGGAILALLEWKVLHVSPGLWFGALVATRAVAAFLPHVGRLQDSGEFYTRDVGE